MLQELTHERTNRDTLEWIDQLLNDSTSLRSEEQASHGAAPDASEGAVDARPARKRGRPRATPKVDEGAASQQVVDDRPAHVQHRWAGGWTCWVCHRWSPTQFTSRCEKFVEVSWSDVPGTVPRPQFHWDRWRLVGPLGRKRGGA